MKSTKSFRDVKLLIQSDLYRVTGKISLSALIKQLLIGESFKYLFWMRICHHMRVGRLRMLYPIPWLMLRRYMYKFGIAIQPDALIGPGCYISHFGGVFASGKSVIGSNVNFSQDVTLGRTTSGKNPGAPVIGNNVYLGPGVKVVGGVKIGNHAAIGANCVVTSDVPDYGVMVGIPGKVISTSGSGNYIYRADYDRFLDLPGYLNASSSTFE